MCTETSPRTPFSGDLSQSETDPPVEQYETLRRDTSLLLDSDSDFEFRICRNSVQELYPADEIFSNGVIIPLENVQRERSSVDALSKISNDQLSPLVSLNRKQNAEKESEMHSVILADSASDGDQHLKSPRNNSKSFWNFKRSLSLNRYARKSFAFSFPLLTRSNSTGSVKRPKTQTQNDFQKQRSDKKQVPMSSPGANPSLSSSSSFPSSLCSDMYRFITQKPPAVKKHSGGGFRFIPVLSVPPLYVSKFGIHSILRNPSENKMKMK